MDAERWESPRDPPGSDAREVPFRRVIPENAADPDKPLISRHRADPHVFVEFWSISSAARNSYVGLVRAWIVSGLDLSPRSRSPGIASWEWLSDRGRPSQIVAGGSDAGQCFRDADPPGARNPMFRPMRESKPRSCRARPAGRPQVHTLGGDRDHRDRCSRNYLPPPPQKPATRPRTGNPPREATRPRVPALGNLAGRLRRIRHVQVQGRRAYPGVHRGRGLDQARAAGRTPKDPKQKNRCPSNTLSDSRLHGCRHALSVVKRKASGPLDCDTPTRRSGPPPRPRSASPPPRPRGPTY